MKKRISAIVPMAIGVICMVVLGCKSVQRIDIISAPTKTVYGQGQNLDLAGLVVNGIYSDDSTKLVTVRASNVLGYSPHRTGPQTVTVRVGKGVATFDVTVKPLVSISLARQPTKQLYRLGETIDLDGIVLRGTWEEIGSDVIPMSKDLVAVSVLDTPGKQNISILFEDKAVSFPVEVIPLSSIVITQPPKKIVYREGEKLDLSGIVVTGTWKGIGNQTIPITANEITGFNSSLIGQQVLMVTVQDVSASFTITVKRLEAIAITRTPTKATYEYGETLDLTGLIVQGTYSDLSKEQIAISASNVTGFNNTNAGQQVLEITVGGKTATFPVEVIVLSAISIQRAPNKGVYNPGESLDLNGLAVVGTYSNGSTRIVPQAKLKFSGFNSNVSAQQTQTVFVTAEGRQTSFTVTILAPSN